MCVCVCVCVCSGAANNGGVTRTLAQDSQRCVSFQPKVVNPPAGRKDSARLGVEHSV